MTHYLQVRYSVEDGRAKEVTHSLESLGTVGKKVKNVELADVYTFGAKLDKVQLEKVADALHTPLSQTVTINKPNTPESFDYAIEIGFLPGVTDNVGSTVKENLESILQKKLGSDDSVYSSKIYFLSGSINKKDTEIIADSLHNSLIQRATIKSAAQFKKDKGMGVGIPEVKLTDSSVSLVDLYLDDEDLKTLGKRGVKNPDGTYRGPLGLGLDELKVIRNHFHALGRLPTDVEIEALAQTWSEHCKHTIFANPLDEITDGIYKHYIKRATKEVRAKKGKDDFCVSVFSDNSGIIEFDKDTYITHKVETHNSPSALDPFGGAVTGILGVNRDTIGTGLGAKPLLNMYGYCFADPADQTRLWRDRERKEELLSAKRIMDGVIEGVNAGGNQSGVPTPQGFTYFEKRYRGKPLVFVGTVGIIPKKVAGRNSYEKAAKAGDYIVVVGGRVGLDGIHGATFSSEALDAGSPATAVQIGDAITQKKLSDALIKEARDKGLYSSITDNGAGGISSSVGEMAEESGGCEVWLDKVPVKYAGLAPWQIWISESQERITLSIPKKNWPEFQALMNARGVEATVIGEFNDTGVCKITYQDEVVLDLDMDFMHDGNPIHMQLSAPYIPNISEPKQSTLNTNERNMADTLLAVLRRANLGSTEFISSQYDHEVQGVSVTKPLHGKGRVNAVASVSRPHTDTKKGIVLSQGLNPRYSDLDCYHMASSSIDQAIRNVVAMGADPAQVALLDNFCWCSSDEPERLHQLKEAARACYEYATAYSAPFISGKDSMFNDFKGFDSKGKPVEISVPPTLLISSIAITPDVRNSVTLDAKQVGDLVYVVGETWAELGGGEYMAYLEEVEKKPITGKTVPSVYAKENSKNYSNYFTATKKSLIRGATPLDRGGLSMGVIKTAIAGQLGIEVDLSNVGTKKMSLTEKLFSESNGRILVTVAPEKASQFEKTMKGAAAKIGMVSDQSSIVITNGKKEIAKLKLSAATTAYRSKFKNS